MSKGKKKRPVLLIIIAIVIIVAAAILIVDLGGFGGEKTDVTMEIPEGAGSSVISEMLSDAGIIKYPIIFKMYSRINGEPVYQKGKHILNANMGYGEIVSILTGPPEAEAVKRVVIPEGYELRQIADILVENGLVDRAAFMNEIENGQFDFDFIKEIPNRENRLEGYLYPDTYLFAMNESEHDIINKFLTTFNQKVVPVYVNSGTEKPLDEIIIFASVVEREAADDEERPLVSSVFSNRIEKGMKLESCATVQYILKERKDILSLDDIAIDSPYNTYKYTGLPVGPIASPGLKSIEAALNPADTDYLYFLATSDGGKNLFSETFEEHNRKLAETQG